MKPQTRRVLTLLRANGPDGLTHLEALYAGCGSRLAARVAELREDGYDVRSSLVPTSNGAHVARYVLHEAPVQAALW